MEFLEQTVLFKVWLDELTLRRLLSGSVTQLIDSEVQAVSPLLAKADQKVPSIQSLLLADPREFKEYFESIPIKTSDPDLLSVSTAILKKLEAQFADTALRTRPYLRKHLSHVETVHSVIQSRGLSGSQYDFNPSDLKKSPAFGLVLESWLKLQIAKSLIRGESPQENLMQALNREWKNRPLPDNPLYLSKLVQR